MAKNKVQIKMIKAGRYYIRPNRISPINLKQADIENFSQQLCNESIHYIQSGNFLMRFSL